MYFYPLEESLRAKSNQVPVFSDNFKIFLQNSPSVNINSSAVQRVGPSAAEQTEQLQIQILQEQQRQQAILLEQETKQRDLEQLAAENARIAAEHQRRLIEEQAAYQAQLVAAQRPPPPRNMVSVTHGVRLGGKRIW